jgi:anti-sigma B factor antagonist
MNTFKMQASVRCSDELEEVLNEIKHNVNEKGIILDFSETTRLDSSGLGMLVRLLTYVRNNEGEVKLKNINKSIANLFLITKLEQVFDIID